MKVDYESMKTIDMIIKLSTEFYNDLKADEHDRYRSWEHCYSHFMTAQKLLHL
ncbi:hypothetical protein SMIDD26_01091 [Streptococcus mitis]|uniref:Uncharacterized protein n=1 Tax=Streptococcus mitis TaxID=28037 RepID=A0A139PRG7_STRMT|nr:hypothetical protein SMIDD26_01091 [Streptococcus mitis]